MSLETAGMVALGIIGGVPLYALVAGYVTRAIEGRPWAHRSAEWYSSACPYRAGDTDECDCNEPEFAGWTWPVTLTQRLVLLVVHAVIYIPARAAYRAALRPPESPRGSE